MPSKVRQLFACPSDGHPRLFGSPRRIRRRGSSRASPPVEGAAPAPGHPSRSSGCRPPLAGRDACRTMGDLPGHWGGEAELKGTFALELQPAGVRPAVRGPAPVRQPGTGTGGVSSAYGSVAVGCTECRRSPSKSKPAGSRRSRRHPTAADSEGRSPGNLHGPSPHSRPERVPHAPKHRSEHLLWTFSTCTAFSAFVPHGRSGWCSPKRRPRGRRLRG